MKLFKHKGKNESDDHDVETVLQLAYDTENHKIRGYCEIISTLIGNTLTERAINLIPKLILFYNHNPVVKEDVLKMDNAEIKLSEVEEIVSEAKKPSKELEYLLFN